MRRYLYILTLIALAASMALSGWGCKNPDDGTDTVIPPVGKDPGGPIDPDIPPPFTHPLATVLDIATEGDGDIVIADEGGLQLFTPYGVFKRTMSGAAFTGLATANLGVLDTGRGIKGISPDINNCNPFSVFDDVYVSGGVPHVSYNQAWWEGEPDPLYPTFCFDTPSTSTFASCTCVPHGITYHPWTAFAYQKVIAPNCIADGDCPWPFGNTVDAGGHAILAYHPDAPLPNSYFPPFLWVGTEDFLVHYDFPTYQRVQGLAEMLGILPACSLHNLFVIWDITSMNYMSSRSGMTCSNICDIEFDSLGRLVMALPNADSVAITEPVSFGDPIVIQQVLGGRQNGMGTLPGEFQGPTAVAIDPRNQNILVSDTGNGRVQIFDNDGNFIREFGGADPTFVPRAIRVDSFGAIYVANWSPLRNTETDNLRIFDEYGQRVQYGTIEGWVYDKDTQIPVDNCIVSVQSTFNPLTEMTDGDGHFQFDAVAAGRHDLVAEKYGFTSAQAVVTVSGGQKTIVDLYLTRLMTEPPGYGQVTGTVFSSLYNEPVPGLTAEIVGEGISNQTNSNGEFILYTVPTGEHIIRLSTNGVIYYESYITVNKGEVVDLGVLYLPIP